MAQLVAAIRRIAAGTAQAAGVPEDRLPVVTVTEETVGVTANDPALTRRLAKVFTEWMGADRVSEVEPVNAAEDFSLYGQTAERVPSLLWRVGATRAREVHRERAHRRARALEPQFGLRARARADDHGRRHDDDGGGARASREEVIRPCPT